MRKLIGKIIQWFIDQSRVVEPHHDSRPNSYYQISQQSRRDARNY